MIQKIQEVEVGSGLIVNKNNEFLFVKALTGAGKGLWNNPGGRRNLEGQNETIEECALREIEEESGILPSKLDQLVGIFYFKPNENLLVKKHVFLVKLFTGFPKPQAEEIEEVKWFSKESVESNKDQFTEGALQSVRFFLKSDFFGVYFTDRIP